MSPKEAASAAGGRPLKAGPEVIEHWFVLVPRQQFSSDEFYSSISETVAEQKVPSLDISRVEIARRICDNHIEPVRCRFAFLRFLWTDRSGWWRGG